VFREQFDSLYIAPMVLLTSEHQYIGCKYLKNPRNYKIHRMLVILCLLELLAQFHQYIGATNILVELTL
jgi:hypothetical protein